MVGSARKEALLRIVSEYRKAPSKTNDAKNGRHEAAHKNRPQDLISKRIIEQ